MRWVAQGSYWLCDQCGANAPGYPPPAPSGNVSASAPSEQRATTALVVGRNKWIAVGAATLVAAIGIVVLAIALGNRRRAAEAKKWEGAATVVDLAQETIAALVNADGDRVLALMASPDRYDGVVDCPEEQRAKERKAFAASVPELRAKVSVWKGRAVKGVAVRPQANVVEMTPADLLPCNAKSPLVLQGVDLDLEYQRGELRVLHRLTLYGIRIGERWFIGVLGDPPPDLMPAAPAESKSGG